MAMPEQSGKSQKSCMEQSQTLVRHRRERRTARRMWTAMSVAMRPLRVRAPGLMSAMSQAAPS